MAESGAIAAWIGAAVAAAGTAMSVTQAQKQNKAAKSAAARSRQAAELAQMQLMSQSDLEKEKEIDRSQQIAGRIKVAMGESGVGLGAGTTQSLLRQNLMTTKENIDIINQNTGMDFMSIHSQGVAQAADYLNRRTNELVAGFSGFTSGASTGLSIGNAYKEMNSGGGTNNGGTPTA